MINEKIKPVTLIYLYNAIMVELRKGNADKIVMVAADDECNEFHPIYFTFTDDDATIKHCYESGMFREDINPKDAILLG